MNAKTSKILILLYLFSFAVLPSFAGIEYDTGMKAYNNGQYAFAKTLFENALKKDSRDVNSRYMYAQLLMKEKKYALARRQYTAIISVSPSSQAAELSRKGIKLIDDYLNKENEVEENSKNKVASEQENDKTNVKNSELPMPSAEPDYLKNAYKGGKLYKRPRGTTRIYIQPNSSYKSLAVKAFNEWEIAIGSAVMFTYIANSNDASINLSFQDTINSPGAEKGGITEPTFEDDYITKSNIIIRTTNDKGEKLPEKVIYHILLHEIGHAIGIMGHSTDPNDVMYTGTSVFLSHLSQRDKNTARALYNTYNKKPDAEAVKKAKVEELENIEKRISNDPSSYIDLGDEYMTSKEYDKATEQYKKAELLIQNKDIYYRLIKAYNAVKDTDNEVICLKKILEIDKTDKVAFNNLIYYYSKERRYKEAQTLVNTFVQNNPERAKDTDIIKYQRTFSDRNIHKLERRDKLLK